jgi:HTH-type transcriptional regulator, transcriptional repressor of NAD biosynthesis genes
MKRGLVIGKFMPLHLGHVALIRFAAGQCDELIVSMSYTLHDPIDAGLRFNWICEHFQNDPHIKPFMIADDFDDESLPLPERTRHWAVVMQRTYPPIDVLFSSESYGEPFAINLGAGHYSFDPRRTQWPVSATQVRTHPFAYWQFIPPEVRPYFVKKICLYGPESTGKSTLAERMAQKYNTVWVPEVARELITTNDFSADDIIRIGHAQTQRVIDQSRVANKLLFCDTDVITTQIYAQHYLNEVPPVLYDLEKQVSYDAYLLLDTDVPWVADGLRDLGDRRETMFAVFKQALDKRGIPYTLIRGSYQEREDQIIRVANKLLSDFS